MNQPEKIWAETLENERFYYDAARPQYRGPSVTTILGIVDKGDFIDWAVKQAIANIWKSPPSSLKGAQEIGMEAWKGAANMHARVGTKVHDLLPLNVRDAALALGGSFVEEEEKMILQAMTSWYTFKEQLGEFKWVAREQPILYQGPEGLHGGTYDGVWELDDGREVIVEFKTSRMLYPVYYYQVAAYRRGYESAHNVELNDAWLIRLNKYFTGSEIKNVGRREVDNFDAAHRLYNSHQRILGGSI